MYQKIRKKYLPIIWRKTYLYPPPEPEPRTPQFWFALALVSLAVLLFSCYFILYLTTRHAAFLTNAEDLGILDQSVWSTIHGQLMHQTICNILHDTNCGGPQGIMRFAIHFEPILLPISGLYLLWSNPQTLVILQTLVVALGAFPAFWLARRRLHNEWIAVAIAVLYLLYPAQLAALVSDFHPETLTASLLLFVLYFLYTRQTGWLFVFALLSILCKEEISLLLIDIGIWSMIFQRRWRSGLALTLLGLVWFGLALEVFPPIFSPTGKVLLISRYKELGGSPLEIVKNLLLHPLDSLQAYVFNSGRMAYLRVIIAPSGYLALLAPWVLIMALPTLVINLTSSALQMHDAKGLSHYSAEMVPFFIFATIEAVRLILWAVESLSKRLARLALLERLATRAKRVVPPVASLTVRACVLAFFALYLLLRVYHYDAIRGPAPFAQGFHWPVVSAHDLLAEEFIVQIPVSAAVSAQSALVPHLSQREQIYLFPYGDGVQTPVYAEYIFLDISSDFYPFYLYQSYQAEVEKVLVRGNYGILKQSDGYILLKRGLSPPETLPSLTKL